MNFGKRPSTPTSADNRGSISCLVRPEAAQKCTGPEETGSRRYLTGSSGISGVPIVAPSVSRDTFRLRAHKWFREWGFYFGALLLTLVVTWSLNFVQSKTDNAGSLIDSAINQGLRDRVENLSSEERDSYSKQAENLSDEQKEQLKKAFGQ